MSCCTTHWPTTPQARGHAPQQTTVPVSVRAQVCALMGKRGAALGWRRDMTTPSHVMSRRLRRCRFPNKLAGRRCPDRYVYPWLPMRPHQEWHRPVLGSVRVGRRTARPSSPRKLWGRKTASSSRACRPTSSRSRWEAITSAPSPRMAPLSAMVRSPTGWQVGSRAISVGQCKVYHDDAPVVSRR